MKSLLVPSLAVSVYAAVEACGVSGQVNLYSFGSSWTDKYFNTRLLPQPSAQFPFGNSIRCNSLQPELGCNYIDYIVDGTYPSGASINQTTTLAYNFATSGTTVNNSIVPGELPLLLPDLGGQVELFTGTHGAAARDYADQQTYHWSSATAIFVMFMGDNDINNWAKSPSQYPFSSLSSTVSALMTSYHDALATLYARGARYFLVIGTPAQEYSPELQSSSAEIQGRYIAMKWAYDAAVADLALSFPDSNPDATFASYNLTQYMLPIIADPVAHGYNADAQCQQSNQPNPLNCTEAGQCCIWSNTFHATPRVHYGFAQELASVLSRANFPGYSC